MGTGDAHDVDVATIDARTRKTIVDGRQRQFRFGGDTGILPACEPFERDRGEQFIVAKEARRSIVLAVVKAEEVHAKDLARCVPRPPDQPQRVAASLTWRYTS